MTNHELRKLAEAATPGELKPCPFCGGSDLDESANGIFCGECHAQVLGAGATSDRDTWNRRAELDSLRAPVAVSEVRSAAFAEAAKLIEDHIIMSTHNGKELRPRGEGNQDGMAYAAAIRALGGPNAER